MALDDTVIPAPMIRLDDATLARVAAVLGIQLPPAIRAAAVNEIVLAVLNAAEAFRANATPAVSTFDKYRRFAQIGMLLLLSLLGTYNASKPSPATPADVQSVKDATPTPEQVAAEVWK